MFVISVIVLLLLLVEVLGGSSDKLGDLGLCGVVVISSGPIVWAGCSMAFRGVHLSTSRLRTPFGLWFRWVDADDISRVNIERDKFRDVLRATVVAISQNGVRTELQPLSVASLNPGSPLLKKQIDVVGSLRQSLGVMGDDNAPSSTPNPTRDRERSIYLLPQERILMRMLGSRYDRNKKLVSQSFEAAHGARGRKLLTVGALQSSLGGFLFLFYIVVITLAGVSNIWPGYVIAMIFIVTGGFRIVQANRSGPDTFAVGLGDVSQD